jgi:large subunit ribosomal protein L25
MAARRPGKDEITMETRLKATPIQARTKGELKRLRKNGMVPVSLQHRGEETRHLQMPLRPFLDFIRHHGESALIELEVAGGATETALLHEVHRDGVTHLPIQLTFKKVVRGEPVKAHVPVVVEGIPEPVRNGEAVLQPGADRVEVRCLPADLPEEIRVDASGMQFGDIVHVSDLSVGDKVEMLTSPETVVVSLAAVRRAAEEEAAPAEEAEEAVAEAA